MLLMGQGGTAVAVIGLIIKDHMQRTRLTIMPYSGLLVCNTTSEVMRFVSE